MPKNLRISLLLLLACNPWFLPSQEKAGLGPRDGQGLPATDLSRVKVGGEAPDFTLESKDGERISLSDFRGQKNVVLVFYRGHW